MKHAHNQLPYDIIVNNTINIEAISFHLPDIIKYKVFSTYIKQIQPAKDNYSWLTNTNGEFTIKRMGSIVMERTIAGYGS